MTRGAIAGIVRCAFVATLASCGRLGFDGGQQVWTFETDDGLTYAASEIAIDNGAAHLATMDQTDDDGGPTGFGSPARLTNTTWNGQHVELDAAQPNGSIRSRMIDAGRSVAWTSLAWVSERPSGKPLPDDASETVYAAGNVDMSGARFVAHMDDRPGATIGDTWGLHDGAATGATMGRAGRFGSSIGFANTDVDFGSAPELEVQTDLTVSLWAKRPNLGSEGFLISRERNSVDTGQPSCGWCLYFTSSDGLLFCLGDPGGDGLTHGNATTQTFANTAKWYNVVATQTRGAQLIYVDGTLQHTETLALDPGACPYSLILGHRYDGGSRFTGDLDEVAIFARTLTATEVKELYLRGATRVAFQVRSCPDPSCTGIAFVGPDGTSATSFTAPARAEMPVVSLQNAVPSNRYIQYEAELESDSVIAVPRIASVAIGPAHVFGDTAAVATATGTRLSRLSSFRAEVLGDASTVGFQVSADAATWYYFAAGAWTIAPDLASTSTAGEIDAGAASYVADVGRRLFWRAVLRSPDGVTDVELAEVAISFDP